MLAAIIVSIALILGFWPFVSEMVAGGVALDYWLRWQVLVCALIIIAPAIAAAALIARGERRNPLRAADLWVPCWRKVHPLWLLVYRGLVVLIMTWLLYRIAVLYGVSSTSILSRSLTVEMVAEGKGLHYWMQWQVFACALIIVVSMAVAVAMIMRSKEKPLRAMDIWVPCWRKVHPLWLLGYRGLVFLAMTWLLYRMFVLSGGSISVFYFYTQWTFTLVIVYFAIATLISAHGCWIYSKQQVTGSEEANRFLRSDFEQNRHATPTFRVNGNRDAIRLQSHHEQEVTVKRAGLWGYTMQIVYQTSAGAVMLTDVVFWGLLVPFLTSEDFSLNLIMGCMHSLNAIFLLLDTALNSLPFPAFRMAYFVMWSCTYIAFQWVLHACGVSWWPYPFLELSTPWAPLWYFGMALIHIPCYAFYWYIVKAKNTFLPKIFPNAFVRSC